jgi:lysophospholipase L1-like esterase
MFGFVSASTGISVYSGSVLNSYGAQSNNPMAGGYLGTIAANTTSGASGYVEMAAVLIYGRGLSTTAEVPNLSASLNRVLGIAPQLRDVFVADGDSITEGYQSTFLFNRPRQTQALLAKPMNVYDKGYFGDTIMHRVSNYAADIAPIYNPLAINNILEIAAGTNDIGGTTTDVQVEGYLQSYITAAHATGWKVIVATILPRNGFTTTQNTYLANVNTWIRAGSSGADAIADYAADPTMGNSASVTNTTYYADGTHPTTLGYGYLAPIEAAAVNGLLH